MLDGWDHTRIYSDTQIEGEVESDLHGSARLDISSLIVREFIQNAMDNRPQTQQQSGVPVVVNMYFTDRSGSVDRYFKPLVNHIGVGQDQDEEDRQWRHQSKQIVEFLNSEKRGKKKYKRQYSREKGPILNLFDLNQKCMVLEDYNTTGLTGDISDDPTVKAGKFKRFMYRKNSTGTNKHSGGSHGSGRKSLLYASCIRSILIYTRREDEPPEEVVSGISFTQVRRDVNGDMYAPNSRFVETYLDENKEKRMRGYNNKEIVEEMKRTFGLREVENEIKNIPTAKLNDKAGLSIVIPFPDRGLKDEDLELDILVNYALSIYDNKLIVIRHGREGNAHPVVYHKDNIQEIMMRVINRKKSKKKESRIRRPRRGTRVDKINIVRAMHDLLVGIKSGVDLEKPDVILPLDREFKGRIEHAFKKQIETEKGIRGIQEKYENFEVIYVHVKKEFVYEDRKKKDQTGHYRLFLKKEEEYGYSLLMRGFTIYLSDDENRSRKGYSSLTVANSKENGQYNPYAIFLRACETMDHRKVDKSIPDTTNVENHASCVRDFRDSYKICECLEQEVDERVDVLIEDPLFAYPRKKASLADAVEDGKDSGGEISSENVFHIETEESRFIITPGGKLIERGFKKGDAVEVSVYYMREGSDGKRGEIKKDLFPSFDISLDRKERDGIDHLRKEKKEAEMVYINSIDFRIECTIKEEDVDAEYRVICELVGGIDGK